MILVFELGWVGVCVRRGAEELRALRDWFVGHGAECAEACLLRSALQEWGRRRNVDVGGEDDVGVRDVGRGQC